MKLSEILAQRAKEKEEAQAAKSAAKPAGNGSQETRHSGLKVVRTRETPNPNALQYVLNAQILDNGNKSYASAKEAAGDVLGEALFKLRGVANVYVTQNFVTVTKEDSVGWNPLKDQIWKSIDKNVRIYPKGGPAEKIEIDVENFPALSTEEKLQAVEMVLNRSIRTNLAADGGGVEVKGIEDNVVRIEYQGACGSCATSTSGTLQYIQNQLRQQLHPDLTVQPG